MNFTLRQIIALIALAALVSGVVGGLSRFAVGNERRFLSVETADKLYFSRADGLVLVTKMVDVEQALRDIRQQLREDSRRDAEYQAFIRHSLESGALK